MSDGSGGEGRMVPIRWSSAEDVEPRYANNIIVQPGQTEIVLSFFAFYPPVVAGPVDEQRRQLDSIEYIDAKCVARIVVDPDRLREMITVAQATLDNYNPPPVGTEE